MMSQRAKANLQTKVCWSSRLGSLQTAFRVSGEQKQPRTFISPQGAANTGLNKSLSLALNYGRPPMHMRVHVSISHEDSQTVGMEKQEGQRNNVA